MKPGARPGGTPGAPAGQPGAEGESVFSKILPGGAAEQAGKLTEGTHCLGSGPHWVAASLVEAGDMGVIPGPATTDTGRLLVPSVF